MPKHNLPKAGDRIRLVHMGNDPDPVPAGTEGTVRDVSALDFAGRKETQIHVNWDNGRSLSCICPPDIVQVIKSAPTSESIGSR